MIFNTCLIDLVNQLKHIKNNFQKIDFFAYNLWKRDKQLKYSKYLFIWDGRWQISNMNSRTSSIKEEEYDGGQDFQDKILRIFIFLSFNIYDILLEFL